LLIAVNEHLCSNSNPGRSAASKRGRAEYGGGQEVAGPITLEIDGDTGNEICFGDGRIDRYTTARIFQVTLDQAEATGADAGQPGLERGHRTLIISTKGGQVVTIPLAPAPPGRSTWPAASAPAVPSS
jgi:hypothetical protein